MQVNLYVDRLEIINPGGLYGDVTIESLGTSGVSSARNQFLSNILETTPYPAGGYVVENRGTGYQEIGEQLRRALMPPARPHNSTVAFSLTLDRRRVAPSERKNGAAGEWTMRYLTTLRSTPLHPWPSWFRSPACRGRASRAM